MKNTLIAFLVLAGSLLPGGAAAQEPKTVMAPVELSAAVQKHQLQSEVWALQKQNAELRAQIADLVARLDSVALNSAVALLQTDRQQLEEFIRASVGAPANAPIDWSKSPPTVTWTPAPPKKP